MDTFNDTVGKEKNIAVERNSQGSVNDLETQVMAAAQGKVGALLCPTSLWPMQTPLMPWTRWASWLTLLPYFTDEERAAYVDSYLTEGDFDDSGSIKIFRWQSPRSFCS